LILHIYLDSIFLKIETFLLINSIDKVVLKLIFDESIELTKYQTLEKAKKQELQKR